MISFKSLGKFLYLVYFGLFSLVSFASYICFGVISVLVMKSRDVLFIHNIVSFHKVILLLFLFSAITWALVKVFLYMYEFTNEFQHLIEVRRIMKKLLITSFLGFTGIVLYYQVGLLIGHPFSKDIVEMNVLAVIVFAGIIDLAKYLSSYFNTHIRVILATMLLVLFTRTFMSVLNGYIPVEFSSVAYLFVPFVFILRIKKLYVIASYIAALAGVVYYSYIIINGGATYNVISASEVYTSMFFHGTLLLVGIISMKRLQFTKNNYLLILAYMVFNIMWAISNRPANIDFRLFIYELIDGEFLKIFIQNINPLIIILYYGLISSFLIWSVKTFNKFNMKWNMQIRKSN